MVSPFSKPNRRAWLFAAAVPALVSPGVALAEEPEVAFSRPEVVDHPVSEGNDARHAIDRTWLYGDDARIPLPLAVVATSSFSYTDVGGSPTRVSSLGPNQQPYPGFSANTAQPGGMMNIGGELGLLPHLSVQGTAMVGMGGPGGVQSPDVGALASLRVSVLPDSWKHVHLVLSGGYLREAWGSPVFNAATGKWLPGNTTGENGTFFQASMSGDIQRLRLAGTVHGEHVFAGGRDPLDVMVDLGASYRVAGGFRAGVEYVGQDLEEAFTAAAEGGARHFIGPIASLQLWRDRLTLVAGPSVGLSRLSPDFVGRVGASIGF